MELTKTIVLILVIAYAAFVAGRNSMVASKNRSYRSGWDNARQVYYTDRLEAERAEREYKKVEFEKERQKMDRENRGFNPITSELLMAYGVVRVGDLPRNIKEAYNITDDMNSIDLDTMIRNEQQEGITDA